MRDTVLEAVKAAGRKDVIDGFMNVDVYEYFRGHILKVGHPAKVYTPKKDGSTPDYTGWNVTYDVSIETNTSSTEESPGEKKMMRVGAELISPVFVYQNLKWVSDFRKVFGTYVQWKPNRSTGLHVHISLEHRTFKLEEIKSLAKNILVFEGITFERAADDR